MKMTFALSVIIKSVCSYFLVPTLVLIKFYVLYIIYNTTVSVWAVLLIASVVAVLLSAQQ